MQTASVQTLVRESPTGNYRLTYADLDAKTFTITVQARDRISPSRVRPSIDTSSATRLAGG